MKEPRHTFTPIEFEAFKAVLTRILYVIGTHKGYLIDLKKAKSVWDIYSMIEDHNDAIVKHFQKKMNIDNILDWLGDNRIDDFDTEAILDELEPHEKDLDAFYKRHKFKSLIAAMKHEQFMEIIDDVQLSDLDELTAKYRPNSIEAKNQMRMVV
jgi:hypothetical protein